LFFFFALCYSTDIYLAAYYAPSCDAATGYAVLKFALTSGSCFNSGSGGLLLNTGGSVSFFSSANCSGNVSFSVASGSACANGTFSGYQSFSQMVPSGVYIQTDLYQNQNCSTPTYPFNTYLPNATNCLSVSFTLSSISFVATPAPNVTLYYYTNSKTCSSPKPTTTILVPGCNTVRQFGSGIVYLNIGIQDFPVPTTTGGSVTGSSITGSSITGSSITGSSVTGTSITGTSVTGTSVTGTSITGTSVTGSSSTTGASGSTTGSSSSNDSNVFYPSLFLLVSLFLTSLF